VIGFGSGCAEVDEMLHRQYCKILEAFVCLCRPESDFHYLSIYFYYLFITYYQLSGNIDLVAIE
jgi:hypothetical protein